MREIIDATIKDIPIIQHLAHQIWPNTFAEIITPQQIDYMLNWMYSPQALKKQISENHHFLLIKEDKEYLGYCSYQRDGNINKLHKIYILPDKQGFGYGKSLLEEVVQRTKKAHLQALQLNVNRYNKAVSFYKKTGFRVIKIEDNPIGNGYFMNDFVMELPLS